MKKIFTLIAAAFMAASVNAQDYVITGGENATLDGTATGSFVDGKGNAVTSAATLTCTTAEGFTLYLLKDGKTYSNGGKIELNGETITTFKLSNGAWNQMDIPSGVTISKIEIIGYSNDTGTDSWISNLGSVENGTYTEVYKSDGTGEVLPKGKDASNLSTITITGSFKGSILFKNGGKQPCLIMRLYKASDATGINAVETTNGEEGAMFNLAGQRVGKDFKGVVVKNGKKVVLK